MVSELSYYSPIITLLSMNMRIEKALQKTVHHNWLYTAICRPTASNKNVNISLEGQQRIPCKNILLNSNP